MECVNNGGMPTCNCSTGWSQERDNTGLAYCEAAACIADPCDTNAGCVDGNTTFTCTCNTGYTGNGTHCSNINECDSNPCDVNADCVDSPGSYSCTCKSGFTGNGTSCSNIDDCVSNDCHTDATCNDGINAYTCSCDSGFTGNGTSCSNIDECANSPCHANAGCTDSHGSYSCLCNTGYTGNGTSCDNINECDTNPCHENADCDDTDGGYTCTCNTGYTGNGTSCSNINECDSNPCVANANCTDTEGSYTCACSTGFALNGTACDDVNECSNTPCDTNAACLNTEGSFTCRCSSGYTGNGFSCSNIDDCVSNTCDAKATCTDGLNDYNCTCNAGYEGDGFTCTPKEMMLQCNNDSTISIQLPYTRVAEIIDLEYGDCNATSAGVRIGTQDPTTFLFEITLDVNSCNGGVLRNLVYNQTAEISVGKLGYDNTKLKFSEFNVDTTCEWVNTYTVKFNYGTLASDDYKHDSGSGIVDLTFDMYAYNEYWNETVTSTTVRRAGHTINLGLNINSTHNVQDPDKQFAIKTCKATTVGQSSIAYTLFDATTSCENPYINLSLSFVNGMWRIQHILFLIDSQVQSTYELSCDVIVCDVDMPTSQNQCTGIINACG